MTGLSAPRSLKLTVAYDGSGYAGWQTQPRLTTVQGALEEAWRRLTGESARLIASGRTDAGVHARGQVASVETRSALAVETLLRGLNALAPRDIAVLAVEEAPPGFHAIRDALRKRYRYTLQDGPIRDVFSRGTAWHYPRRLDDEAMRQAAAHLVGKHDFASFQATGAERASTVRTIFDLTARRETERGFDCVGVEVEADGFLYNMVRSIVGSLVEVGRGAQPPRWLADVLAAQSRQAAGPTAPAHGLCLLWVKY